MSNSHGSRAAFIGALMIAVLVACVVAAVPSAAAVVQINFMHRHGAREEPLLVNGKMDWSLAQLTPPGETMMNNLGKLLRSTYPTLVSATTLNTAEYKASSGDSSRCIQSAEGAIIGLFSQENNESFTPSVPHVTYEKDWWLEFNYNFPTVVVRDEWYVAFQNNNTYAREVLDATDIQTLVNEFGSQCNDIPMMCALYGEDVSECRTSNGGISTALNTLFQSKLRSLQVEQMKHQFAYNSSDPYKVTGSSGYALASLWLDNARSVSTSGVKVFHYSAHDTTVAGLLNSLGSITIDDDIANSVNFWAPRYGTTVLMAVHDDGQVSFSTAVPEQESGSTFDYVNGFVARTVNCIDASGATYTAAMCPLEDVARYVNTMKPTVSDPYCYLTGSDVCDAVDVEPSSACAYYRQYCPLSACGPNAVVNGGNGYMCESFAERKTLGHYSLAAVLSSVLGAAVGAVIGLLISVVLSRVKVREERRALMSTLDQAEI